MKREGNQEYSGLSDERVDTLIEFVRHIVQDRRGFKVFPPREVRNDPAILQSEKVAERLENSQWWLRIDDGQEEVLTLPELLVFVHNLSLIRAKVEKARAGKKRSGIVSISVAFDVAELLKPTNTNSLLASVKLEGISQP